MKKHLGLFLFVLVSNIVYGEDIGMVPPAFGNSVQEYYLEAFRLNREKRSARLNVAIDHITGIFFISEHVLDCICAPFIFSS